MIEAKIKQAIGILERAGRRPLDGLHPGVRNSPRPLSRPGGGRQRHLDVGLPPGSRRREDRRPGLPGQSGPRGPRALPRDRAVRGGNHRASAEECSRGCNPRSIAVNFSVDDEMADGLTHGQFLLLQKILDGTPWASRLVSSEGIVSRLRARKMEPELDSHHPGLSGDRGPLPPAPQPSPNRPVREADRCHHGARSWRRRGSSEHGTRITVLRSSPAPTLPAPTPDPPTGSWSPGTS